jgi:hypothetical protein
MKKVEITPSEESGTHFAQVFSCHKVIPRPANQDHNWYEWNTANWGSKWDLSDPRRDDSEWEQGIVRYSFESAWSPVVEVISALAKEHKKLSFTYSYWEGGSDFWGEHDYKKGKEVSYEGGSLDNAGCHRLEQLMGDHHQCQECYEAIGCNGETTQKVCDDCETTLKDQEKELWEMEKTEWQLNPTK